MGSTPTSSDFENGPLKDHGRVALYIPVTVHVDNTTGENTYSDGTSEDLDVVFENANTQYSFTKAGLSEGADARMFILPTVTLNKNDKIVLSNITYRVDTISDRYFNSNAIFRTVLLFRI